MKYINQTNEEDSLTEFDNKMILEMKTIPQLKDWTDKQYSQYCLALRWYSKTILSIVDKENEELVNPEKQTLPLTVIMNPLKQAA